MNYTLVVLEFVLSIAICGCESPKPPFTNSTPQASHDAHAHPSKGPHGGGLIELGNEKYHAEMVHDDDAKTVTIYLLDAAAKVSVPIEASEIIINLKHEGQGEQFKVTASPEASDPADKSSRFVSTEAKLAEELDHEGAESQLVVTIDGKPYRGKIEHQHEIHGHAAGHEQSDHTP